MGVYTDSIHANAKATCVQMTSLWWERSAALAPCARERSMDEHAQVQGFIDCIRDWLVHACIDHHVLLLRPVLDGASMWRPWIYLEFVQK